VVTVPTSAIQRGAPGTYVYLLNPDGTVAVRAVKLGPTDGDKVQVVSGVTAGQQVVVDGTDRLRDGARVSIPAAKAPADGGGAAKHQHGQQPAASSP
jgi:membrane fusion protein, multidrug efflux system